MVIGFSLKFHPSPALFPIVPYSYCWENKTSETGFFNGTAPIQTYIPCSHELRWLESSLRSIEENIKTQIPIRGECWVEKGINLGARTEARAIPNDKLFHLVKLFILDWLEVAELFSQKGVCDSLKGVSQHHREANMETNENYWPHHLQFCPAWNSWMYLTY